MAVADLGTNSNESVDYPEFGTKSNAIADNVAEKGILVCGSGIGISISATVINTFGVRWLQHRMKQCYQGNTTMQMLWQWVPE